MTESIRVVLVDPDPRTDLEARLVEDGAAVDRAGSIADCLDALADADCVVFEHDLPDGTGVALCERVRARRPRLPLVAFTDAGSEAVAGDLIAAGADGYVPKSQGAETAASRVRALVDEADTPTGDGDAGPSENGADGAGDFAPGSLAEPAKAIVDAVGDGVYALDDAGRLVAINDAFADVIGYDRERLLGSHVSRILTAESVERGRDRLRSAGERDDVVSLEATLVTSDGDRVPSEVHATPLRVDGEVVGSAGVVRDVTDRKEIERELLEYTRTIEHLHGIVSRLEACDTESDVFELTVEVAEGVLNFDACVVGSARGEYLVTEASSSDVDREYEDRRPIDEGLAGDTYRNGRTYRRGDLRADDGASSDAARSVLSVPIGERGVFQAVSTERDAFDRHDEELAELLVSHVADALDRLAFERRLREERDRFVALFENVPDAVVSTRHDGTEPIVERVNPAFEEVFGYDADEIVGEPLDRYIVPQDAEPEARAANRRGSRGEVVEREVRRRTADGLREFMMRVVPIEIDAEAERAFCLYTDVTDQKQRQQRVEVLNRVLRHDLRNGMNVVVGSAEMLAEAVDDDRVRYADAIEESADELVDLAEKTRDIERTLDREDDDETPVDVVAAVESAIDRVRAAYPSATVETSLPDGAFGRADLLFETAVGHVVENAVEHNDRSRPTVEVTLEEDDGTLVLSVADDGPGLPDQERELLEEGREITQLRHASGLGLWLVNWVVGRSGGTLSFGENDPRGTVVRIRIPAADAGPDESPRDGSTPG